MRVAERCIPLSGCAAAEQGGGEAALELGAEAGGEDEQGQGEQSADDLEGEVDPEARLAEDDLGEAGVARLGVDEGEPERRGQARERDSTEADRADEGDHRDDEPDQAPGHLEPGLRVGGAPPDVPGRRARARQVRGIHRLGDVQVEGAGEQVALEGGDGPQADAADADEQRGGDDRRGAGDHRHGEEGRDEDEREGADQIGRVAQDAGGRRRTPGRGVSGPSLPSWPTWGCIGRKGIRASFARLTAGQLAISQACRIGSVRGNTQAAIAGFLGDSVDYLLVAYAREHEHVVVTHERPQPMAQRRVLIPDACAAMGVSTTDTFRMLRSTGTRLTLGHLPHVGNSHSDIRSRSREAGGPDPSWSSQPYSLAI